MTDNPLPYAENADLIEPQPPTAEQAAQILHAYIIERIAVDHGELLRILREFFGSSLE